MKVGERIANRRKELNMTQEELARRIGVCGKSAVCHVETTKNNLTISTLEKYAKALDTTVLYLLGSEEDNQNVNTIGGRIRQRRNELGMSMADLAKRTGYKDHSAINKIETNQVNLSVDAVERFAYALYCSPVWLAGWSDKSPSKPLEKDNYVKVVVKGEIKQNEVIPVKLVLKEG